MDPYAFDGLRSLGKFECTTGDIRLVGRLEPGGELETFAEMSSIAHPERPALTLRPEPRVTLNLGGPSGNPHVACDTERARVYVGSLFLGFIVAYGPDGHELWRMSLAEFQTVIGQPIVDRTTRGFQRFLDTSGSILHRLEPMGPFVAVAYRVKGRYYQTIIHRSGVPIATIGPWDGLIMDATSDGWLLDAGGEIEHGDWKLPTEELMVRLKAKSPELLIEHFITYNLPQPQDTSWTWRKCDGDNRFGRLDLGPRFDPKLDEIARQIHDGLGTDWARIIAENEGMMRLASRGDRPIREWRASIRVALLDAGADVDCVRYASEHGLLEAALR